MSDAVHGRVPRHRADRSTTSCSECRRRKQRCSQGQPCINCARRFPQPACEYKPLRRPHYPAGYEVSPAYALASRPCIYDENELPGISEGLSFAGNPPEWARRNFVNVRWSGVDETTNLPTTPGGHDAHPPCCVGDGGHGTAGHRHRRRGSALWDGSSRSGLPLCERGCRSHSDAIHDAVKLVVLHHFSVPDRFLDSDWGPHLVEDYVAFGHAAAAGSPWPVEAGRGDLSHLPMAPTKQNGELLRIYVKLLARFKGSVDGNPEPGNPIVKYWLPFCIQDPLLLHILLYTSACFLNETGHAPRVLVMAHKGRAIRLLNEHLRSDAFNTTDAAIVGVVQLIVDEWYWGGTRDLRAHMRGLREMVRLRGGLSHLGMHGFLGKFVIVHDVVVCLAHEVPPFIYGCPGFEFHDPAVAPFKLAHNTPLVYGLASFADCAAPMGLHPSTASILDDVRFLTGSVLDLPAVPTPQQLQKVTATASWVVERIANLPAEVPPCPVSGPAGAAAPRGRGRERAANESTSPSSPPSPPPTDPMHRCVRMAALIYCRAVAQRCPLGRACTPDEFMQLWAATWGVPLSAWKGAVGIFMWVMMAIAPRCHRTPHGRFVKSMAMLATMTLAIDNWHVAMDAVRAVIRLHSWLRGEDSLRRRTRRMGGHGRGGEEEARDHDGVVGGSVGGAEEGHGEDEEEDGPTGSADMVARHGFEKPGWEDERTEY